MPTVRRCHRTPSRSRWLQALGPRAIPTDAAVAAELQKLLVEEGRTADGASSEEEEEGASGSRTALAKEPSDYFGFVG